MLPAAGFRARRWRRSRRNAALHARAWSMRALRRRQRLDRAALGFEHGFADLFVGFGCGHHGREEARRGRGGFCFGCRAGGLPQLGPAQAQHGVLLSSKGRLRGVYPTPPRAECDFHRVDACESGLRGLPGDGRRTAPCPWIYRWRQAPGEGPIGHAVLGCAGRRRARSFGGGHGAKPLRPMRSVGQGRRTVELSNGCPPSTKPATRHAGNQAHA